MLVLLDLLRLPDPLDPLHLLHLLEQENIKPAQLSGSWAGAVAAASAGGRSPKRIRFSSSQDP